jgi:hypothetical protein
MRVIARDLMVCLLALGLLCSACSKKEDVVRVAVFTSDPMVIKILNGVMRDIEAKIPGAEGRLENIPSGNSKTRSPRRSWGAPSRHRQCRGEQLVEPLPARTFEDLSPYVEREKLDIPSTYPRS